MSPLGLRKHQNSSSLVFEKLTLFVGKSRSSVPPSAYLPACLNKLLYKDILRLLWEDIFHFVLNQEEIWQKMFWSKIAHFHTLYNTKYDIECFQIFSSMEKNLQFEIPLQQVTTFGLSSNIQKIKEKLFIFKRLQGVTE